MHLTQCISKSPSLYIQREAASLMWFFHETSAHKLPSFPYHNTPKEAVGCVWGPIHTCQTQPVPADSPRTHARTVARLTPFDKQNVGVRWSSAVFVCEWWVVCFIVAPGREAMRREMCSRS